MINTNNSKKQSWWQLLSIQTGGTICLPVIMIGSLVCQKFGWAAALLSVGAGNLFLLILGYLLSSLSTYRRQSTVEHATTYFGKTGKWLFGFVMILSMLGWFGIQLNVMCLSAAQLFSRLGFSIPFLALNIAVGLIISLVMCLGMKAMKNLSYVTAPLLGVTLLYAAISAKGELPAVTSAPISWTLGLSLVIGANIAAVIDLPTFFRHAKSTRDAKLCILLLYGIVVPLIEITGVYLFSLVGGESILDTLQIGHGELWAMWICCFVLLSGWQTNNANLYSCIASSVSLPGTFPTWIRAIVLGGIGTLIGCFNPLGNIESVLDFLGITIGAMGAVILANYVLEKTATNYTPISQLSLVSWAVGVAISICCLPFQGWMAAAPAIEAFLASFVIQTTLNLIYKRRETYERTNN
jgi:purine-cytosine permease-like protein